MKQLYPTQRYSLTFFIYVALKSASLKIFHIPAVEHMALTGTLTQITARSAKSCMGDVMMISLTSK